MYLRAPDKCSLCHSYHDVNESHFTKWTDVYAPSAYGPGVWFDRYHLTRIPDGVVASEDAGHSRISAFWVSDSWIEFADGGVSTHRGNVFPIAQPFGTWVHGWGTLRFSCHVLGLTPPSRRLKGEPFVPDSHLLVRVVMETLGFHYTEPDPADRYQHLGARGARFWTRLDQLHREAGKAVGE